MPGLPSIRNPANQPRCVSLHHVPECTLCSCACPRPGRTNGLVGKRKMCRSQAFQFAVASIRFRRRLRAWMNSKLCEELIHVCEAASLIYKPHKEFGVECEKISRINATAFFVSLSGPEDCR